MYVNYYSNILYKPGMTQAEFNKSAEYNRGRIITKYVEEARRINDTFIHGFFNRPYPTIEYTEFKIPKHNGKMRTITAPNDELKAYQKEFADILVNKYKFLPHNAAHGFVAHRNCKTALQEHQRNNSKWFLKLDIKDFFPSVTYNLIATQINQLACFNSTAKLALRILIKDTMFLNDGLPQGSPASPVLSNIAMFSTDVCITAYCKENNLIYTRYADDILISGKEKFNYNEAIEAVALRLPNELSLSTDKTRFGSYNGHNFNLGLVYNNQGNITVGHNNKHQLRALVHNAYRDNTLNTQLYTLAGKLSYYRFIEPEYFNRQIQYFKSKGYTELLAMVGEH